MRRLIVLSAVLLAACQSNPTREANYVCNYHGWDTPQCAYAQQQAAAQQAHSRALIQQGLSNMPQTQPRSSLFCQPVAGGVSCN